MLISRDWLNDFIQTDLDDTKVAEILTSTGLEVEKTHVADVVPGGLRGVVVGHVLTVAQHPNADRLRVTTVDVGGEEPLHIVCGAPNVAEGQKVPVATIGCELYPGGGDEALVIKKGKIRGEVSMGMICAEDELGLGVSHDGIMVLDSKLKPGTPLAEALNLEADRLLEIGLTPNRMDAMGHHGVARDLAAALAHQGHNYTYDMPQWTPADGKSGARQVNLVDAEACPRYWALSIENVCADASPEWLQRRLKAININPQNILVDATNFALHTLGHPLHAFDANNVHGAISVRRAKSGETMTTLDGVERKLHQDDLLIADEKGALALAGVFGGEGSGVSESTTSIVIESAWFDPVVIRKGAKRHGLNTDASFRYERGVDPSLGRTALDLAWHLIKEVCPEARITGLDGDDQGGERFAPRRVDVNLDRIDRLIGEAIPEAQSEAILNSLDIAVANKSGRDWALDVPAYRWDVTREADVAEEVLRIYGFNAISFPAGMRVQLSQEDRVTPEHMRRVASEYLVGRGFHEIANNSLTRAEWYQNHPSIDVEAVVPVLNPLSQDLGVMRPSMIMGGLEAIAYNNKRRQSDVAIFEWGRVYSKQGDAYHESEQLAIWLTGQHPAAHWSLPQTPSTFAVLKGVVEGLVARFGIKAKVKDLEYHEGQLQFGLVYSNKKTPLVELGWTDTWAMERTDVEQPVVAAIIHWDAFMAAAKQHQARYQEPPKHPSVSRDLALVVDQNMAYGDIRKAITGCNINMLQDIELFDVYQGKNLPKGKLSYGIRLTLQDPNKTLKDKQVDGVMQRFIKALQDTGAEIRG